MNLQGRALAGALLLMAVTACSSDADHDHSTGAVDISNAIYVGGVTDEALERLLDVTPKDDARQAIVVDSPDLSEPLPADIAATFEFHLASQAMRTPGPRKGAARHRASHWQRAWHEVVRGLSPVSVAHAHGTPYNGTAYYLVVTDADAQTLLQVFTPQTSYQPEADAWHRLADAKQPLKLGITSAFFEDNDIPADGGPFVGGTFEFRIE